MYYYQILANMSLVNGFKGYSVFGIRQLTENEMTVHCNKSDSSRKNATIQLKPGQLTSNFSFSFNYGYRILQTGFYYMNVSTGLWSTDGVDILPTSNLTFIHGQSSHCTEFAGGFIVLPSSIDFNSVWANSDFINNPTIYITVIVIVALYMIVSVFCIYKDRLDNQRITFTVVDDNILPKDYLYEMVLLTGNRDEAATDSKISCILSGELSETTVKYLVDDKKKFFKRGAVNTFLLASRKYVFLVLFLRINKLIQ